MIYYIFKTQVFTIFLSLSHLTALNLSSVVTDYVGGQEGDYKIYELNKGRSLVFETKKKDFDRNMIVFMRDSKLHFNVRYDEAFANKDIVIKEAKTCTYFTLLKETSDYQLFDCPRSLYFINKRKTPVRVNDLTVKDKAFISKGPPVYLEKAMIYFQGRAL